MASLVGEVVPSDLCKLVSDLRSELAEVKKDLSDVMMENRHLKEVIESFCSVRSAKKRKDSQWKVVNNGVTRVTLSRRAETVPCSNSFSVLSDEVEDQEESGKAVDVSQPTGKSVKIVGDSLCRHVGKAVKSRISSSYFFPGAGVRQIADRLGGLVDSSSATCIIVGGNDIHRRRSEDLVRQYKEALDKVRTKGGGVIACGILPRMGHGREWLSRAIGFNCRIEEYCRVNSIEYVDVWEHFYGRGHLYARDGVHLSRSGVAMLARLIDRAVVGFC